MTYQGTFAVITAALVSGAIVERMRFSAYLAFIGAWSLVVYAPVAHWVWGGGWLSSMGTLDFAGGTVVHVNAGVAMVYRAEGKYPEAERTYTKVLGVLREVLGENHPNVAQTMNGLAFLYMVQGKSAQAERLYTEALTAQRRIIGEDHPDAVNTLHNLAAFYVNEGRNAEAEPLATKAVEIRRRVLGAEHPETLRSVNNLGLLYLNLGRHDQAEPLLRTALSGFEKAVPDGWERYNCQSMLGASIAGQKRFQEAEPLVVSAYQELVRRTKAIPPANASVVDQAGQRVIQLYRDWGKPEKVSEWAKRVGRGAT